MLFTSPLFLFLFLPLSLFAYTLIPSAHKKKALFVISALFYIGAGWLRPITIAVLAVMIVFNYSLGLLVYYIRKMSVLFLVESINIVFLLLLRYVWLTQGKSSAIYYPLGASIFILMAISYQFDVYRNSVDRPASLFDLALYLSFFPVLVAGPIVRYKDFVVMIENRDVSLPGMREGISLFITGFVKKMAIAASLGEISMKIQQMSGSGFSIAIALVLCIVLSTQFFFSLSGYSDMGRGIARMFGYSIKSDFDQPILSTDVLGFFHRFMRSLSEWCEDYIYKPMCQTRLFRNNYSIPIFVSVLLGCLWFKCTDSMFLMALVIFLVIIVENVFAVRRQAKHSRPMRIVGHIYTMLIFMVFSVVMCFDSTGSLLGFFGNKSYVPSELSLYIIYSTVANVKSLVVGITALLLIVPGEKLTKLTGRLSPKGLKAYEIIKSVVMMAAFVFTVVYFLPQYPQSYTEAFTYFVI